MARVPEATQTSPIVSLMVQNHDTWTALRAYAIAQNKPLSHVIEEAILHFLRSTVRPENS